MDSDLPDNEPFSETQLRSRARAKALRALGRREQSSKELQAKLVSQGFDESGVEEVLQELAQAGLQSDRRYAELLVRSRIAQGYGPRRIEAELVTRGIDESTLREVFAAAECDWSESAERLYRKRFGAPPANLAERSNRHRFLAARGFDADHIRAALQSNDRGETD